MLALTMAFALMMAMAALHVLHNADFNIQHCFWWHHCCEMQWCCWMGCLVQQLMLVAALTFNVMVNALCCSAFVVALVFVLCICAGVNVLCFCSTSKSTEEFFLCRATAARCSAVVVDCCVGMVAAVVGVKKLSGCSLGALWMQSGSWWQWDWAWGGAGQFWAGCCIGVVAAVVGV